MALVTALLGLACSHDKTTAVSTQMRVLSTGRRVEVTKVGHVQYDLGTTLTFDYVSKVSPGDIPELRREVEEIWADLQRQAEEEKVAAVFIVPEQSNHTSTGFVLRRNADGTWRRSSGLWAR